MTMNMHCVAFLALSVCVMGGLSAKSLAEIDAIQDLAQARAAVRTVGNDGELAEIALKSKNWRLRADAVYFLRDQKAILKVLKEDQDWRVRVHAVSHVVDLSVIEKVALTDPHERVRAAAGRRTRDWTLRAKMVAEDKSEYVRGYVAEWMEKEARSIAPREGLVKVSPIPLVKETQVQGVYEIPISAMPKSKGE